MGRDHGHPYILSTTVLSDYSSEISHPVHSVVNKSLMQVVVSVASSSNEGTGAHSIIVSVYKYVRHTYHVEGYALLCHHL